MRNIILNARPAYKAIALAMLFSATALANPALAQEQPTIYHGGDIVTMQGDEPQMVEALLIADGHIIAMGSLIDMEKAAKNAVKINLNGKTLLPAFIDAHGHMSAVGQVSHMANLASPPLGKVTNIAQIQSTLHDFMAKLPENAPMLGFAYDDLQLTDGRHPTRDDLDAVSSTRPIMLIHTSGHLAVMNSAMLNIVGYNADTPDPDGGTIRRKADGKTPNGILEESAFFTVMDMMTPKDPSKAIAAIVDGQKIYASYGVTTVQDGRALPGGYKALEAAAQSDALFLDTVTLIDGEQDWSNEILAKVGKDYDHRLRIAGIKLSLDGSPQGRTAWLHDPVPVPPEGKNADYHGYPAILPEKLDKLVANIAKNGWQLFAHVNGDAADGALIDAVRKYGLAGNRTIAIHNQVVQPEQLREQAELDIQPSFFVSHTYFWGDWHRDVALGAKRADFISPLKSALAAGLRPTLHNDSPVTPPDMMRLVWSAVNRRTQSGDILGPTERISAYQALQMITINAAWQIHEDDEKGTLAIGKQADFVVLEKNPITADKMEIADIQITATINDGVVVYGGIK